MQRIPASAVRADPNVAPMIDVMLVLLVIFMIVVPTIAAGGRAVPPQGENLKAHPEEANDQTLVVDGGGRYFLNGRPVPHDALAVELQRVYSTRAEDHVLYISADRELEYGRVRDVMGVAAAAGVRAVGMIAERPPPPRDPR